MRYRTELLRRLLRLSMLTSLSLILFILEGLLPDLIPVPGVKAGLANAVTVYMLYAFSRREAAASLAVRIVLGSFFSGRAVSLLYSLSGGALAFAVMACLRDAVPPGRIFLVSALGAVAHNAGQMLMAVWITRTPMVAAYFPVLVLSGCLSGTLTGLAAQMLLTRRDGALPRQGGIPGRGKKGRS